MVDVGFGRLTLTSPLRIEPNVEQQTTLERFRLMPIENDYQVQIKLGDRWSPVYQVSMQEVSSDDYEVYNWFTSTNPDVVFTNHLMAARPAEWQRRQWPILVLPFRSTQAATTGRARSRPRRSWAHRSVTA